MNELFHMDNTKSDTISIVIPVFNAARYIKKCVISIKKQTYQNWNLILVDDGSTDRSGELCDSLANDDQRIHVIHQANKGSVEARKAGALSDIAKKNPWILMCDADDKLPRNALKVLYQTAQQNKADLVCGNMRKIYKGIRIPQRLKSPCFQIAGPKQYTHTEIIKELFISFFGVSDFPVSLCAKLYRTECLIHAIDFPPVVKFMGDDLSVTIRVVSEVKRLVIIPDDVYYYRIGGGTSKFMPYMMDDFVSLYRYKKEYARRYPMPQNADDLMDMELVNITKGHFSQFITSGDFREIQLRNEIERVCAIDEVRCAAERLKDMGIWISPYANSVFHVDFKAIEEETLKYMNREKWKGKVKSILRKL